MSKRRYPKILPPASKGRFDLDELRAIVRRLRRKSVSEPKNADKSVG